MSASGYSNGRPINEVEEEVKEDIRAWLQLSVTFHEFDDTGFGQMSIERFRSAMQDAQFRAAIQTAAGSDALRTIDKCKIVGQDVTYRGFMDMVSQTRRDSFNQAMYCQIDMENCKSVGSRNHILPLNAARLKCHLEHSGERLTQSLNVRGMASRMQFRQDCESVSSTVTYEYLPTFLVNGSASSCSSKSSDIECANVKQCMKTASNLEKKGAPTWRAILHSPPLFIITITGIQLLLFIYSIYTSSTLPSINSPVPIDSLLVFRSDRRFEIWRFVTYSLVHGGWCHLLFNVVLLLSIGLLLEVQRGSVAVIFIYVGGVLAGSIGTSAIDGNVYLVGASGGVYAILAAQLINVLINYTHCNLRVISIVTCLLIASIDLSYAIYDRYVRTSIDDHPVSYVAHLLGALAGLVIGAAFVEGEEERQGNAKEVTKRRATRRIVMMTIYFTAIIALILYDVIVSFDLIHKV